MRLYYPYKIRLINKIIRKAKLNLVNNSYQADYARKFNKNVEIITAPIDTERFKPDSRFPPAERAGKIQDTKYKIILGWVGSPTTTYMLESLSPILEKLGTKYGNLEIHNIGGNPIEFKSIPVRNIKWNNKKIENDLAKLNVGLMPLDNHPVNRGRLGYKMIIYMSIGIPIVAQDIGLNKTVVKNGMNGFLATTEDDWFNTLSRLIENGELRNELGRNGKQIAVEQYDLKKAAEKYAELLRQISDYGL